MYERTLTVDGEDTTLVVMDTWEAEKLVWHSKRDLGVGFLSLVPDSYRLLGHYRIGTGQGPFSASSPLKKPMACAFTPPLA